MVAQGTGTEKVGLSEPWEQVVPLYVCEELVVIGVRNQYGGQGVDRTMTSTMRTGSVTTHVQRNDVLQQHIDVRTRVGRGLYPLVVSNAMIPSIDGMQKPGVPPSKLPCLFSDGPD